jgi:predicted GNAT superfamily acetyltransferase
MFVTLLDASSPHWGREVERIGVELGAGHNQTLFPYHFLYVTLPKIGGYLALFEGEAPEAVCADANAQAKTTRLGDRRTGIGLLFPRGFEGSGAEARRVYTLRYHTLLPPEMPLDRATITAAVADAFRTLPGPAKVIFYDVQAAHTYNRTGEEIGPVELGRPGVAEARELRMLQQQVWGSPPEFLYPADIHSQEFAAASSIVARVEGSLAGFLFGFLRFGGAPLPSGWDVAYGGKLRLESQTMGVLPAYRGLRIASLLKRFQAQEALRQGIRVIHWTADPLQFPNAALNFGLLRAVAYEFAADLYPFRNDLNRVHASRLGLTWLPGSQRVDDVPLVGARSDIVDMSHRRQIPRVNDGPHSHDLTRQDSIIAVEVPADWTALQQENLAEAQAWRQVTDAVLAHYIGSGEGQYVITGVGTEGDRRYLLAERVSDELWRQLGQTA